MGQIDVKFAPKEADSKLMVHDLIPILAAVLVGLLALQELLRRIDRGRVRMAKMMAYRRGPAILRIRDLGQPTPQNRRTSITQD
jgi:hypothetical protein